MTCEDINELKSGDILELRSKSLEGKKEYEKNRVLYNGVYNVLKVLQRSNIKNVLISDNELTEAQLRQEVLAQFNINQYLDMVITSKDIGFSKPDARIFKAVLDRLNLTANEIIFVAHDKDEIEGAQVQGIRTVEFNNYLNIPTKSDFKIEKIEQLFDIIERLI